MKESVIPMTAPGKAHVTEIVKEYQAQLKGYIQKRIPSREDAEDILQNVFYQLARMYESESSIEQISGWLYSVTRHQIIDSSRKRKEESLPYYQTENEDELLFMDMYDQDGLPEDELLKTLFWEELASSLEQLPEEQRVVFELTELEGFSFKEISETTGIPVNTLISRKRYAVLFLRKRLQELYEEMVRE
ncbi:MAG: RNA polymerase sigma factor [Tannerellaceae bacterium]|nr:RNA polymerase sigma factor [Tannerellaceae bacterium]